MPLRTPYPDRRDQLFGREPDIHALCDRARHAGLTVVAARPLMGKTWTLTEVARRLEEEGTFIVGYHESKGTESSHLLYAVANLYTHWLEDSRMWEQARSLWEQHRQGLLPRVGVAVGGIVEKLGGALLPGGVASLVQKCFEGLATLQKNTETGGVDLAPLAYDEARQLADLVATLSGRRIVLILDAWEKSPSIVKESKTLESVVKAPGEWERSHIVLAVRNPDVDSTRLNNEAWLRAGDIAAVANQAVIEIGGMDRADATEIARLLRFVRERMPAAREVADDALADMIDGYPGVLDFWLREAANHGVRDAQELAAQARNAHALRYREFKHLLTGLKEPALSLAARLTVFPRLDAAGWARFSKILLADGPDDPFYALVDAKILADARFPTFGHDTRHVAARRWLVDKEGALMRRVAERLVDRLAGEILAVDARSRPVFEALVGLSDAGRDLALEPAWMCLVAAARSAVTGPEAMFETDFRADAREACERTPAAAPLIAIALNNRAIEHRHRGELAQERADLDAVIALPGAPSDEIARALANRAQAHADAADHAAALADFDAAVALPGVAAADRARVLFNRGVLHLAMKHRDAEIADYTSVIDLPGALPRHVARALINRAGATSASDPAAALADVERVIAMTDAPVEQRSTALLNRVVLLEQARRYPDMVEACGRLIDWPPAGRFEVCAARLIRGRDLGQAGRHAKAIADFDAVLATPDAQPSQRATAYLDRGTTYELTGKFDAAARDFVSASEVAGAPQDMVDWARQRLATMRRPSGR